MRRHLHVMVYGEYVIEVQAKIAARLAQLLPPGLDRIYSTNSGAEAIEGALKPPARALEEAILWPSMAPTMVIRWGLLG